MEGPAANEIVSFDRCRETGKAGPLSFKSFKQHSIDVPEDMRKYFANPQSYRDLVDIVKNVHVEFDEQNSKLVVSVRTFGRLSEPHANHTFQSFSASGIRRAQVIADIYLNDSR